MIEQLPYLYAVIYDFVESMELENEPAIVISSFKQEDVGLASLFCHDTNTVFLNIGYFKTLEKYSVPSAMLAEVFKAIKFKPNSN